MSFTLALVNDGMKTPKNYTGISGARIERVILLGGHGAMTARKMGYVYQQLMCTMTYHTGATRSCFGRRHCGLCARRVTVDTRRWKQIREGIPVKRIETGLIERAVPSEE